MGIEWKGWKRLGGQTELAPCGVWNGEKTDLYCVMNKFVSRLQVDRGGYHKNWVDMSGTQKTQHAVGAARVSPPTQPLAPTASTIYLTDGFKRILMKNGGAWPEVPVGGLTTDAPNALSLGHHEALFVRGLNDGIWFNLKNGANQEWSGWAEVPGEGRTQSAIASASFDGRTIHLFVPGVGPTSSAYTQFGTLQEGSDGRPSIQWSGLWEDIPGGLLTHLAMSASSRDPANSYNALNFDPEFNRTPRYIYLVAVDPEHHLVYNILEHRDPGQVPPPGSNPWKGWQPIPLDFELGDFVTDSAAAAVLTHRDFIGDRQPEIVTPFDMLCVFARLAADGSLWMNRGIVNP